MRVISRSRLKKFCTENPDAKADTPLDEWFHVVKHANWTSFAEVKGTYNATDQVLQFVVFDVGGNKWRIIAVIDYVHGIVYIRQVLSHKDYDKGNWKQDNFGKTGWRPDNDSEASKAKRTKRKKR
jgi:mRNA interferase HigB